MNRSSILYLVFILTLVFAISCSGGSGNVTAPGPVDRDVVSDAQNNGMLCVGLWQFVADKATGNVDLVQLRSADKILNVLGFMEPPPLTSMDLDWDDLVLDFDNSTANVGVILSHPIPDEVFSGFDVRGVCFGPKVTNADGLTILTGPEYFTGEPFGYLDGLLGAPDSYGHYVGLAGYKYFCGDIDEDDVLSDFFSDPVNYANRGMFSATEAGQIQRNYNLDWNNTGLDMLVFNYAIYANYDWPIGDEPWGLDNWAITAANSAEAFCLSATATANSLWFSEGSGGGEISLDIEIWDWQGDIFGVTIESVPSGVIAQTDYDSTSPNVGAFTTYMYEFLNVPGTPTSAGDLDILITVTDEKTFGECWFLDMLSTGNSMYDEKVFNCFIYTANVMDCPAPTITAINPNSGEKGASVDDAILDGSAILEGALLGALLRMAGQSDIVGTDVQFIDDTQITADFSLAGAETGEWYAVIVNGCGTDSNETDVLFTVTGGLGIKDTGPLPATLPVADEKNFCVVANDLFDKEGIYYFTDAGGYDVSYYDLTYSGPSTLKGSIVDPFFGNIGGLLIDVTKLGSIECTPMGSVHFCNRQTGLMPAWANPADGPVWWCSAADFPNLSNGWLYYDMRFIDLEYVYEDAGRMWGFWVNNPAGVDGATYYGSPSYGVGDYAAHEGYFIVDHTSAGVDGQISKLFVTRFGIDANTNSDLLTAPCDMMWYYIEHDPGNPSVEVCGNASGFAYFTPKYTIDDDELEGLPIDVSTMNNYEADGWDFVEFNWVAILEDYEDGTWCISVWEWDGTAMQLIERTSPIDGTPYNLDCDTENQEIHVWAGDGGTDYYWIFEYTG